MLDKKSCPCPKCGNIKYFVSNITAKNKTSLCKECTRKKRVLNSCRLYPRVCHCGDVKLLRYKPISGQWCHTCRSLELGKDLSKKRYRGYEKVQYIYFCPTCPTIATRNSVKKSNWCGVCSRKYAKGTHKRTKYVWSYDTLEYKAIEPVVAEKKITKAKRKKQRGTQITKANLLKIQGINKKHREQEASRKKPKKVRQKKE